MCEALCGCSLNIVIKWEYTFSKGRALLKKMAASRNKIAELPSICQRAENETRTRDPNLGKVVLYQLSYFRKKKVKRRRLELPRHNCHYPLKVARLPIPPPLRYVCNLLITSNYSAQNRTRTCTSLLTLVPETSASTIPPPGLVELRCYKQKERKTRLELATPTLARLCSTN